ncbi:MAG: ribokinase [Armatimonadetes bacterium]|nr:ribokinase [Armatimonadota bacterium]
MPRIVVVGSSNTDMVVKTERLPAPGETVTGGTFARVPGGKGANQAVAAARLGAGVVFVGKVGMDLNGDEAVRGLEREGIAAGFVARDPKAASGVALIFVDRSGENMIAVAPGANASLSPEDVERAAGEIAGADALVVQLEVPIEAVERAVRIAREAGVRVILNPAPARPVPAELLSEVDVLTPNESEARMLLGLGADEAADDPALLGRLLTAGCGAVILTMGARGALMVTADDATRIAPHAVDAVDATAAGDAFTGALAVGLSEGMTLGAAADFAGAAAALSVTRLGAQGSLAGRAEVEALLR